MRDNHRPKQELIHEITGLRKQVSDLKEAMAARRRVEDALRDTSALLRHLSDSAPVGLGLFRTDGTLLTANHRFATMLGYQSPSELQSLSSVLGVFATPEDRTRALECRHHPGEAPQPALFRSKDGCRLVQGVLAGEPVDGGAVVLVVFSCMPMLLNSPFPIPPA
jgi:PAS domain-containing protein